MDFFFQRSAPFLNFLVCSNLVAIQGLLVAKFVMISFSVIEKFSPRIQNNTKAKIFKIYVKRKTCACRLCKFVVWILLITSNTRNKWLILASIKTASTYTYLIVLILFWKARVFLRFAIRHTHTNTYIIHILHFYFTRSCIYTKICYFLFIKQQPSQTKWHIHSLGVLQEFSQFICLFKSRIWYKCDWSKMVT